MVIEDLIRSAQLTIERSREIRQHFESAKRHAEELITTAEGLRTKKPQSIENGRSIHPREKKVKWRIIQVPEHWQPTRFKRCLGVCPLARHYSSGWRFPTVTP